MLECTGAGCIKDMQCKSIIVDMDAYSGPYRNAVTRSAVTRSRWPLLLNGRTLDPLQAAADWWMSRSFQELET